LPGNYRLSHRVQRGVMAARTINQAWSKRWDSDTYCK